MFKMWADYLPSPLHSHIPFLLRSIQARIFPIQTHQLFMGAFFHQPAILHDKYSVRQLHRAQAVRNDDCRFLLRHLRKTVIDSGFFDRINGGRGFIQYDQMMLSEKVISFK